MTDIDRRSFYTPFAFEKDRGHYLGFNAPPQQELTRQVAEAIAADRDGKIRQALIDLGWTPPDQSG